VFFIKKENEGLILKAKLLVMTPSETSPLPQHLRQIRF